MRAAMTADDTAVEKIHDRSFSRSRAEASEGGRSTPANRSTNSFSSTLSRNFEYSMERAGGPHGKCIISHNSKCYVTWWYVAAFAAVITGIFTPLALAFFPDIRYAEVPLDVVFYIDIILTFFVSIEVHGWTVTNHWQIVRAYLGFYFWWDLLAVIPFELMLTGNLALFLRLFRLLRLARLNQFDDTTWVGVCSPGLQFRNISIQYLTSLYWAITTLTSVGYGDISPQSDKERIWGVLFMFINLGLTAYILGNMTALASKDDSAVAQFREQLDDVSIFLKQNSVPMALRAQVIRFLQLQNAMKTSRGNDLINSLPSAIKMPIKKHQYQDVLGGVDIFRGVSKPFLDMVMANIEEEVFMEGMHVINCADLGSAFYIVSSGQCEILVSPTGTNHVKMEGEIASALLDPGSHFGAEGFFSCSNQSYTIRVSKLCVAIKMEDSVRREMVSRFPRDVQVVIVNIKRRLETLIDLLSDGIKKEERERLKNDKGTMENNFMTDKKPVLKSTSTAPFPSLELHFLRRSRNRKRSSRRRKIPHFQITEYSRAFLRSAIEVRRGVQLYMERHEQDIAANLCQLASQGDHQNLRQMLYGLDLSGDTGDYDGRVPLHLACAKGNLEVCKVLLKYKANPSQADHFGVTPLQEAVNAGHEEVIAFMTRKGAELRLKNVGDRMCQVTFEGDNKLLDRYLSAGADPNAADYDGRTAFHLAAVEGNLTACKMLLHYRADPYCEDRWKQTPLFEAKRVGNESIVKLLISAGKQRKEEGGVEKKRKECHEAKQKEKHNAIQIIAENSESLKTANACNDANNACSSLEMKSRLRRPPSLSMVKSTLEASKGRSRLMQLQRLGSSQNLKLDSLDVSGIEGSDVETSQQHSKIRLSESEDWETDEEEGKDTTDDAMLSYDRIHVDTPQRNTTIGTKLRQESPGSPPCVHSPVSSMHSPNHQSVEIRGLLNSPQHQKRKF